MGGSEYFYAQSGKAEVVLSGGKMQFFPWHMHMQHWTLGVVLGGTVLLGQPEEKRTLGARQHFVLPPCAPHSLALDAHAQLLTICVPCEQEPHTCRPMLHRLLHHACSARGAYAAMGYAHGLKAMLEHLVPLPVAKGYTRIHGHNAGPAPLVAEAIMQRMLEAPEQPLSLVHMAQEAGYSPWHFLRIFQQHMGLTPHALLTLCRVRKVRHALRADAAGAEAATSAGFTDQSHMLRVFKKHHNMTPGQFVKGSVKVV